MLTPKVLIMLACQVLLRSSNVRHLAKGWVAVYIAKEADITILCATEWRDSRKALAAIVEEFRFAKIKLGGVVFLTSRYPEKSLF